MQFTSTLGIITILQVYHLLKLLLQLSKSSEQTFWSKGNQRRFNIHPTVTVNLLEYIYGYQQPIQFLKDFYSEHFRTWWSVSHCRYSAAWYTRSVVKTRAWLLISHLQWMCPVSISSWLAHDPAKLNDLVRKSNVKRDSCEMKMNIYILVPKHVESHLLGQNRKLALGLPTFVARPYSK